MRLIELAPNKALLGLFENVKSFQIGKAASIGGLTVKA
jgi:hypothetical protein